MSVIIIKNQPSIRRGVTGLRDTGNRVKSVVQRERVAVVISKTS